LSDRPVVLNPRVGGGHLKSCNHTFRGTWRESGPSGFSGLFSFFGSFGWERDKPDKLSANRPSPSTRLPQDDCRRSMQDKDMAQATLPDNVECVRSECPCCFVQKPLYF
jgi:hypothetical protein